MRKIVAGFILLTALDGRPLIVESTQLSFVNLAGEHCQAAGGTVIQSGPTKLCVRESWQDITRKKDDCEHRNKCVEPY